jgi:hypothetical protein
MLRDEPKKPDIRSLLARAGAGKGRKRSPVPGLIAFGMLAGLLALIFWLTWPGPDPPPLMVIASDQLALPNQPVTLRAWLRPQAGGGAAADTEGIDLYFADTVLGAPAGEKAADRLQAKEATGPDGGAAVRWKPPAGDQPTQYVVRYPGIKGRTSGSNDTGRVFTWPAETNLLIVEARHGLMSADDAAFRKANVFDLAPLARASAALRQALRRGYHVVYLATAADRPEHYLKLRGWLQQPSQTGELLFPDGPALGRDDYAEKANPAAVLQSLKQHFAGKLVGVVGRPEDARVYRAEGLSTFLIGDDADVPEKVQRLKSWEELARQLP